ncbi:type IX secretion system motor protein PorM/GldM [Aequorivita viscosa]|uniref:Protein involved in gliding motility GldM n=1 Tax=Aequorivita viscosa TaxID=797419 RepID=A0A1M6L2R1_9FLAO|nr:gliding motility protein GldM [Aequorivita viscosa]SDX23812.1 protein involved in gliding motility GldM [Aequorivita viscosa]SHJ65500.1 protein involved in gliding motility GldM [Aequorivita viscosa]
MAGGKLSPRQKMINMMYLIFIAMLALNMSKEVLSAFGLLNDKIAKANVASDQRNQAFLGGLAEKAQEQPAKYKPVLDKANQVNALAQELDSYIEGVKDEMMKDIEDPKDYEIQDKSDHLDQKWFSGDKLSKAGQEFVDKVDGFREGVIAIIGDSYPQIAEDVKSKFTTSPEKNRKGVEIRWLNYHFEGFPLVASRTKLTQMQADIKVTQNDVLQAMLAGEQVKQLSMSNYQAIVVPDKTAFFNGENFKGRVVLGRFDNTLNFDKVVVNGKEITETAGGQVVLDFPAGNVGEQELKGELQFKEGDSVVSIEIKSSYAVIPKPNAAVISADKMNVVYRGVENPMTISIPGVGTVSANAPGLSPAGGAGKYVMNATSIQGREVKISVSGKLPGGETVSDSKTFRIKDIPRPTGTIRGEDGGGGPVRMQRQGLEISSVGAELMDFDFDLKLNVTGFSFKVAGQPTIKVSGNKLSNDAKGALRRAGRGETVQIFDINASLSGNSGYKLKKISPVFVELTN